MTYQLKSYSILLLISLLSFFANCQKVTPLPPGKLIDAGGHLLHLIVMGKEQPTVILESGSGDFSFIWSLVQPKVAKFSKVVSYDRAGFAWSQPGPMPRTGRQIALELHTALKNAGISPPYILVGQSFGGFLVRAYAHYYPTEVKGMVLVEAIEEDQPIMIGGRPTRIREFAKGRDMPQPNGSFKPNADKVWDNSKFAADTTIEAPLDRLPKQAQEWQKWAQTQAVFHAATDSEMTWSPEDVARFYANKGKPGYTLGDMPLIVLTRGSGGYRGRADSAKLEQERLQKQSELAKLSTNSKHIIDKKSGHNIHLEDPQLVINSIKAVIVAVKTHTKLPAVNN